MARYRKEKGKGLRRTVAVCATAVFLLVVGAALFTASNQLGGISLLPASGTGMVLGGNEEVVTLPVFSSEIKEEISSQPELSSEESVPPKPETSEQEKEESIQSSQPQESSEDSSQQASVEEEESQPETSKEEPSKTSEVSAPPVDPNGPEYQKKYPDMFVPQTEKKPFDPNDKVVYLTFDDGPSALTEQILDILDEYDVKATFFVVAKEDETSKQRLQMIAERGHTIGLHSYTHEYRKIYASVDAFLDDFAKEREIIYQATGEYPSIFRFPGGSVNGFNKTTAKPIIEEMTRRGYTYYDWNVSAGDAEYGATKSSIYRDTVNQTKACTKAIVLCHDTNAKGDTVSQLPAILAELKKSGYRFDKLDPTVKPINFPVPKQ